MLNNNYLNQQKEHFNTDEKIHFTEEGDYLSNLANSIKSELEEISNIIYIYISFYFRHKLHSRLRVENKIIRP